LYRILVERVTSSTSNCFSPYMKGLLQAFRMATVITFCNLLYGLSAHLKRSERDRDTPEALRCM
jgi:hypothetical protein